MSEESNRESSAQRVAKIRRTRNLLFAVGVLLAAASSLVFLVSEQLGSAIALGGAALILVMLAFDAHGNAAEVAGRPKLTVSLAHSARQRNEEAHTPESK